MAEFVANAVQEWITAIGAQTAYIEPGSPWQNGYFESLTGISRAYDYALHKAQIIVENCRRH